jgi:hypothetical protein
MVSRVNVVSHNEYSVFFLACPLFIGLACGDGSAPHDVRGALAASANALEARDSDQFFKLIDERSRFAVGAIVTARTSARALIEADYPPEEREKALQALGDAAQVATPQQLFQRRCGPECMQRFADLVGAPVAQEAEGAEVAVTTVRGKTLHMHAGSDGGYGIVWNTQALSDERAQASRELALIRDNAAVYRRRRALEQRK